MLTEDEIGEVLDAASNGRPVPTQALERCPTIARGGATVAAEISGMALESDEGDRDTGSEIAADVAARGVRALAHHLVGLCAEGQRTKEGREIEREVTHDKEVDIDLDFGMDL